MRDIKFRAWDKEQKYWVEAVNIALHSSGNLIKLPPDIELMQYTGLKDKNGKEIYEGDIVQWEASGPFKGAVYIHTVEWDTEEAMFLPNHMNNDVVVIGNIYENPELIQA